jgi:hypothetical protein
MRAAVRARKEQEAAAQAIDEARAEVGGVSWDSDDDTVPPNGFYDILNEVCAEAGYESDELDKGLCEPLLKVWRLDQASIQASAHSTSHNGLETDAMCCT